jgi:hypothetical protein
MPVKYVRERHKYWLRRDLLRKRGIDVPAAAGTQTPTARRLSRYAPLYRLASTVVVMVIGVWWGLRHPRRPPRQENVGPQSGG